MAIITEKDLADAREVTRIQERLREKLASMDDDAGQNSACRALHDLLPLTSALPISGPLQRILRATLAAALEELGVCE